MINKYIQQLEKKGFVIIRNAISNSSYYLENLIIDNSVHCSIMWEIRLQLYKHFRKIWNTSDLACSFDGNVIGNNRKIDWHVDQNKSHLPGLVSIQGVLALKPSNVTHLLSGSHRYFNEVSERCTDNDNNVWEFYHVPSDDPIWCKNLNIITPILKSGDLLLFDSRLIHSVSSCKDRAVVYVSMVPKKFISNNIKKLRREGFLKAVHTTHWCERFIVRDYNSGPIRKHIPKKYKNLI